MFNATKAKELTKKAQDNYEVQAQNLVSQQMDLIENAAKLGRNSIGLKFPILPEKCKEFIINEFTYRGFIVTYNDDELRISW